MRNRWSEPSSGVLMQRAPPPRLLSAFPSVPDLPKSVLAVAHRRECRSASQPAHGASARAAHAATGRHASQPSPARALTGRPPFTPGRLHAQPPLALSGGQHPLASTAPARVAPQAWQPSGCSIPLRRTAHSLPSSGGLTARTLPLHNPWAELAAATASLRGPHASEPVALHKSRSLSPARLERVSLSATLPSLALGALLPGPMRAMSESSSAAALGSTLGALSLAATTPASSLRSVSLPISLLALSRIPSGEEGEASHGEGGAGAGRPPLATRPGWAIAHAELSLLERIGIGSFGVVYRASWRGQPVAAKLLRNDRSHCAPGREGERAAAFVAEMQISAALRHPNVVRFLAGCLERGHVAMVHELCAHSLHDVLHTGGTVHVSLQLPLAVQLKWAREVALGVAYLHAHEPPILHRDLKPGNVLLSAGWVAKLADFGLARTCERACTEAARIGTAQWTAPELLRQQPHDERADVYSFGVVLYELASRRLPYGHAAQHMVEVGVITGKQPRPDVAAALGALEPAAPASVREALGALAEACLEDDYARRPRFPQVVSELQSAQNLLLRDAPGLHEWLRPRGEARALGGGSAADDFGLVAEGELERLLDRSRALLEADERQAEAERAASESRAEGGEESDSDSDRGSARSEGEAAGEAVALQAEHDA